MSIYKNTSITAYKYSYILTDIGTNILNYRYTNKHKNNYPIMYVVNYPSLNSSQSSEFYGRDFTPYC